MEAQRKEQERRIKLMNADPNDEEAQKEIEEMIRKEMVNQNYLTAQEQFPEFFGQITMLYVNVKVNKHPI
jgi:DNA damage-inducible protein 1